MRMTSSVSRILVALVLSTISVSPVTMAADGSTAMAAQAVNAFGLDLFRQVAKADANALISPYSIQSAMAMAYAGADGVTREEMARVLHYPKDETQVHRSFSGLRVVLENAVSESARCAADMRRYAPDEKRDPLVLAVANRLFGQTGYDFHAQFLARLKDEYNTPFESVDFIHHSSAATARINDWINEQTKHRIQDSVPPEALNELTRLVLVSAIYLKAGWTKPFDSTATKPDSFFINGRDKQNVPTMRLWGELGYAKGSGYSAVTLYYDSFRLRFLIFLPDKTDGLVSLEKSLTPDLLAAKWNWDDRDVTLHLPKFKLEPPVLPLAAVLQSLGMKSAFDKPLGSANFDRLAPRRPDDYLSLSAVFHKSYLNLDEQGTEAAAATVFEAAMGIHEPKKPVIFKVDHPFLFVIQHVESGACLFLGHVTDPR